MSAELRPNPLRAGLSREKVADPCAAVIFGGTGDLATRKLLPALYRLHLAGLLPRAFAVLAYASSDWTDEQYRESVRQALAKSKPPLPVDGAQWESFAACLRYCRRTDGSRESIRALGTRLAEVDVDPGTGGNYLFYFAVPPSVFAATAHALNDAGLAREEPGESWRRLVVEKPFGEDLRSARELNRALQEVFREDQIYRIDHYLGKETVQNILVFRFANHVVEPLLNSRYVDHIQITVAESIGIEGRGAFYDSIGALRDIIQNHALQVMSLVCMERPSSWDAESIRDEKAKALRCVRKIAPNQVNDYSVRGQYGAGRVLGDEVRAYRQEDDVSPESNTETYVALKLLLDSPRWDGVPVYIRTGKRLARRVTEVGIQLKEVPPFALGEGTEAEVEPNVIAINVQPDEGISVSLGSKVPGMSYRIQPVRMDFRYTTSFGPSTPEAYERLLLDAMVGDQSLYARADAVEASWEIVDPVLNGWRDTNAPLHTYMPGSWGPPAASEFMERDRRKWRMP